LIKNFDIFTFAFHHHFNALFHKLRNEGELFTEVEAKMLQKSQVKGLTKGILRYSIRLSVLQQQT
jgi:hypothetical protein